MGIYSNMAAQLLKEQEVAPDPNAAGLLEFAVNSQKAEHAMFEAMIEMDILEYHCESGSIVLTEEEKENGLVASAKAIGEKIAKAIEKLIQTITSFINKLQNTIAEKTKADKKLIEKFGKNIDLAKAKANKPDKEVTVFDSKVVKEISAFIGARAAEYTSISGSGSKEDFESRKSVIEENLARLTGEDVFKSAFNKKKISELTDAEVKSFVDIVDGGQQKLVDDIIGASAKKTLKGLNEARTAARKLKKGSTEDSRDIDTARYNYVSALNTAISKAINFGSSVASHALAASRSSYIAVATAAAKKEEAKQESAVDYDEILEYALEIATENIYGEISFA